MPYGSREIYSLGNNTNITRRNSHLILSIGASASKSAKSCGRFASGFAYVSSGVSEVYLKDSSSIDAQIIFVFQKSL